MSSTKILVPIALTCAVAFGAAAYSYQSRSVAQATPAVEIKLVTPAANVSAPVPSGGGDAMVSPASWQQWPSVVDY